MFNLSALLRPNIAALTPYSSARDEYTGTEGIFLDANENPFGQFNRYPDPYQKALKAAIALRKNIAADNIFLGNGSDEAIDIVFRIFCNPGRDKALIFTPTYGMYQVSANINDVQLISLPLDENFQPDIETLKPYLGDASLKLIFLCSPNNPTGNCIAPERWQCIAQNFNGILVMDEAYIDFAAQPSAINLLEQYPNLIVLQTFSKAWGMAAVRTGMAFAQPAIIQLFNKVKPPYNISLLNQQAVLQKLQGDSSFVRERQLLIEERQRVAAALPGIGCVRRVYPSDANFLLAEVSDANGIYATLAAQQIITRNRASVISNCLRITIGTPEENNALLKALNNITA
jgi:histidinol-phosphate aminotransferase